MAFEAPIDRFLFDAISELVQDILAFTRVEVRAVERPLEWAALVEDLTIHRHRERWREARLAILRAEGSTASELYRATPIELSPQIGLVPIGVNPGTKLWEIYHPRSAIELDALERAEALGVPGYGSDGRLEVLDRGLVFVRVSGRA